MANRLRVQILLAFGAFVLGLALLIWILSVRSRQEIAPTPAGASTPATPSPSPPLPVATPPANTAVEASPAPSLEQPDSASTKPSQTPAPLISEAAPFASATLLIPVAGVRPEQLRDTFQEARSEGRVHDAIDIPAARGTPVLAAADGRIVKFFNSQKGGVTIYQLSADERLVYYYAHLERYADGLTENHYAHRGEVIAYVGDTGNAGAGNYHLHFSVAIISDPKRYWTGTNINPYPLLRETK